MSHDPDTPTPAPSATVPINWAGQAPTPEQLREILRLHADWYLGRAGGVRADLDGANLGGNTVLSDGIVWREYLDQVVPALLTAGGRPLAEVATPEVWSCHSWSNCPMHAAFGANSISEVPPLYRGQAERFVQLYDAGLIPVPTVPPTLAPEVSAHV